MSMTLLSLASSSLTLAAVGIVAKVTVLIALGAIATVGLREASAATRHLVWSLTLAGSVALVVLSPVAPEIAVRMPVVRAVKLTSPVASQPASAAELPAIAPIVTATESSTSAATQTPSISIARPAAARAMDPTRLAIGVWLAGFIAVLFWSVLGHAALMRLSRSSVTLNDPEWRSLHAASLAQSGIARPVVLLESAKVRTPVTWGMLRPAILFPAGASAWTSERKRVILLHELAHVARLDYLTQLLATIACALFWFHPAVWVAARRLRVEAERACDDQVLDAGMPGIDYASHLLDVARRMKAMHLIGPAAVGMARPSQLEERLLAVLTTIPSRRPVTSRMTRAAIVSMLAIVLPVAGLRPILAASSEAPAMPIDHPAKAQIAPVRPAARPATAVVAPQQKYDFQDSVSALPDGELELDLRTGATLDIKGWDRPWVRVRGVLDGPDADRTRVSLASREHGALLRSALYPSGGNSSTSHKFEIMVPRKYNIRLNSAGGGLELTGVEGVFRGETGGGSLTLDHVIGEARLSTGGGDITVTDSDLEGRVTTGGGSVVLSGVTGGLRGSSGSGPIIYSDDGEGNAEKLDDLVINNGRIRVGAASAGRGAGSGAGQGAAAASGSGGGAGVAGGEARAVGRGRNWGRKQGADWDSDFGDDLPRPRLNISKAGGDIDLAEAPSGAFVSTGGGDIEVGRSSGVVDAHTGGGDIVLGPVSGSARAITGAGKVSITIVNADGQVHNVDVSSGSGTVLLVLPADIDARFELETAYTNNFSKKTKIVSDFTLERDESTEWTDDYGTPRKFVTGTATFGKGRGLIRVKTVNGDITVRRTK